MNCFRHYLPIAQDHRRSENDYAVARARGSVVWDTNVEMTLAKRNGTDAGQSSNPSTRIFRAIGSLVTRRVRHCMRTMHVPPLPTRASNFSLPSPHSHGTAFPAFFARSMRSCLAISTWQWWVREFFGEFIRVNIVETPYALCIDT